MWDKSLRDKDLSPLKWTFSMTPELEFRAGFVTY